MSRDTSAAEAPPRPMGRKRVAIVATIWTYLSHAQHIGDRFLVGYPLRGRWHRPAVDVVSLYVHQRPEGDQSEQRAREFGFRVYPTIQEALRCGGDRLAVDAVLIIAEHGEYPSNEKGQKLYPRYEFFQQVVEVFEKDGRSVPVFNDKHLSFSFAKAQKMVAASRRLKFPMLAGSSLPVTWRLPPLELPLESAVEEALLVYSSSSMDSHGFHALEALQCMVERRRGGETGVRAIQVLEGDAVWKAGEKGAWSQALLEAAISRCDSPQGLTVLDGRTQDLVRNGELRRLAKNPAVCLVEYRDGLRAALLMLEGAVADITFAARLTGVPRIQSNQFLLTLAPNVTYSACLAANIEEMIETGRPPYPVERTLLVSGILESCLDSRFQNHRRLETPHLDVRYRAPQDSHFCRD